MQRLGGRRNPVPGRARGDLPDGEHERYSVEIKHRKQLPGWVKEAVDQATQSARYEQIPIVVIHEHNKCGDDDLVCIPMRAWEQLFNEQE